MTPVNSTLGTPPTSFVNYEQAKFQDGDIVLLAIALEQANSAKETLKSQAEAMAANVLAKANIVSVSPDGPWRFYDVRPGSAAALAEWLDDTGLSANATDR